MTPTYRKYKAMRDNGMSVREIAESCGTTYNAVYVLLWQRATPERYAAHLERQHRYAERHRRARGMRTLAERHAETDTWARQAALLRQSGLSSAEIGRRLGVSKNSVVGALWRRGVAK